MNKNPIPTLAAVWTPNPQSAFSIVFFRSPFHMPDGQLALAFSDKVVALDIDGTAGQAYQRYQAALDRTPDEHGLAGWIKFMDEGGSPKAMAQQFIDSQEFRTHYSTLDDAKFVNQLYLNVVDRNGEPSGIAGWVGGGEWYEPCRDLEGLVREFRKPSKYYRQDQKWHSLC